MQNTVRDNISYNVLVVATDETSINVSQPITNVVEIVDLGPQGPVGPVGPSPDISFLATTGSNQFDGSQIITGSVTATSFTGSLLGTASWSNNSLTSSFLNTLNQDLIFNGNLTLNGTASIDRLVVNQTSLSTGSNQLGDAANDTQTLFGSVIIPTGSLVITGSLTVSSSNATQFVVGNNLLTISSSGQIGISGSIIPNVHNTYTLGTSAVRFGNIWSLGNIVGVAGYFNNLALGTTNMSILNSSGLTIAQWYGATGNLRIQSGSTPAFIDNGYKLQLNSLGAVSGGLYITGSSNQSLIRVDAAGIDGLLFLNSNGNLGIGTTTPGAKLEVFGTNELLKFGDGTSGNDAYMSFNSRGYLGFSGTGGLNFIAGTSRPIIFGGSGSNFTTYNEWARFQTGTGYLGIGTTNPGAKLDVNGTTYLRGVALDGIFGYSGNNIAFSNAGNTTFLGNIGIGTTTPNAKLDISGSVNISGSGTQIPFQITSGSTSILFVSGGGNVGIGTNNPSYLLDVAGVVNSVSGLSATDVAYRINGSGILGKTTAANFPSNAGYTRFIGSGMLFSANNDNTIQMVIMPTTGNIGIGTTTPGVKLDVSGDIRASSTMFNSITQTNNIQTNGSNLLFKGSGSITRLILDQTTGFFGIKGTTPSASLDVAGTTRLSGSFNTAVSGAILTVIGSGSAQPIFTVQGSQGELFSINDSLSGSLFSVNDISGLPILEVFSDNTILTGDYQAPSLNTTKKISSTVTGSNLIYSFPTSSYDGAFMDYTVRSGSNARAGNFVAIWSGSSVNYMDNSTTDFGSTTGMVLSGSISGSNMVVFASGSTAGWVFKGIIRSI